MMEVLKEVSRGRCRGYLYDACFTCSAYGTQRGAPGSESLHPPEAFCC